MTTKTKLEIMDARFAYEPTPERGKFRGKPSDEKRKDTYAENLIGEGNYTDSGCHLAPSCFACPFERCELEVSEAERTVMRNVAVWDKHKKYTLAAVRSNAVKPRIAPRIAEEMGLATRTVYRIVRNAKNGIGISFTPEPKPVIDAHEFLTGGLFKQGMTWKKPIPTY
jgi:hypothetical protein